MQVTENVSDGLRREFDVKVPAAALEARVVERLGELKGRVRINGFRPGKVPVTHLKKVYGRAVMAETIEAIIREMNAKIVSDHGLKLAEQLLLHFEILEHGFHDDVAALEVFELVGDAKVGVGLGDVGIGQPALGDEALQGLEDGGLGLGSAARGSVEHDGLHAAAFRRSLGRHLRDAAAHGAGSDHAHDEVGAVHIESHFFSSGVQLLREN